MTENSSDNPSQTKKTDTPAKLPVVGIGASAGGLEAFKAFFDRIPSNTGMAFVLIPHLDPAHKSLMVEIISRYTKMPVIQVEGSMKLNPDHVYIVQPNRNLDIEKDNLFPREISRSKGINLPVDFFFRSLAVAKKERAIGIILSGTMSDGTMGLRAIKEHGGMVIVQAPETAQHEGMPQSAINTGLVDFVLPIEEMPDTIMKFIAHPYMHGSSKADDKDALEQVLSVIHSRTRYDFRCYKRNTLFRRTERRMGIHQFEKMTDYVEFLSHDPREADALFKDMLIGVTVFFREEQVWEMAEKEILPSLFNDLEPGVPLRIWVPGCSTGEETYTLAILARQFSEKSNINYQVQIFGTDIDEQAITAARSGIYPESIAAHISPERLKKYFVRENKGYRILRDIRESVVFAVQNLIGDAPFSNLDMISCRNLLIYLEPDIQKKVIELFHFALREGGYLILGSSETIGYCSHLFTTISKELRIYQSIGGVREKVQIPIQPQKERYRSLPSGMRVPQPRKNLSQLLQNTLLKRFAPAAVLINRKQEVVQLYGPTVNYLDLPQGEPVLELQSMAKQGMRMKLRGSVHKAIKTNEVTISNARIKRGDAYYPVKIEIIPVIDKDMSEALFLVAFEDKPVKEEDTQTHINISNGEETLVRQLESELISTREDLQNTIEELETSNEELKASNEEMMSMNEELQSSNEELETSKEELQSLNEELNTVNAELREKIGELEVSNNDLNNLMNSTEVATLFLDMDYAIRRFTPAAKNLFNLIPSDIGRPIHDLAQKFHDENLPADIVRVMDTLSPITKEVKTNKGLWYINRVLPFRTQDNRIGGVVLTFSDVTELKNTELAVRESENRFRSMFEFSNDGVCISDMNGNITMVNKKMCELFGFSKEEMERMSVNDIAHPDDLAIGPNLIKKFKAGKIESIIFEKRYITKNGGTLWGQVASSVVRAAGGEVQYYIAHLRDITDQKQADEKLRQYYDHLEDMVEERTRELQKAQNELLLKERLAVLGHFAGSISHELRNPLAVIESSSYYLKMKLGNSDEKISQYLRYIDENVIKSTSIIESLLNLTRMEKPKTENYDLNDFILGILPDFMIPDRIKAVAELPENHISIYMDPEQIRMALKNIINNSIQAIEESGRISIILRKSKSDRIEIIVSDTGPGIPPENISKIFEPLFTTKAQGIGFGLSITKMIVENHGGSVSAESEKAKGASIILSFPSGEKGDPADE